jgi:hypothetical protein
MKRLSAVRIGRKGRVGLALSAAAIAGLAIVGSAAAANAASTPAPAPNTQEAVLDNGPAQDMSGVPILDATPEPETAGTKSDTATEPALEAVLDDGPAPDMSGVPIIDVEPASDAPETIGSSGTTAQR